MFYLLGGLVSELGCLIETSSLSENRQQLGCQTELEKVETKIFLL